MPSERHTSDMRVIESTESIAQWAQDTFGEAKSIARVAVRANEEMAELLRAVTSSQRPKVIREEAADVVIVLARLVYLNNGDLWEEVEHKMAINRSRTWKMDGSGHGYHVRDRDA